MARRAFSRREHKKRKRLGDVWRKPKGLHSKVRKKQKQYGKMPTARGRTAVKQRFMHPLGVIEVRVGNLEELKKAPKNSLIRFNSGIGGRKRILLLETAKKLDVKIIGVKDIEAGILKIQEKVKNRQKIMQEAAARREKRHKAAEEKAKMEKEKKEEAKDVKEIKESPKDKKPRAIKPNKKEVGPQ